MRGTPSASARVVVRPSSLGSDNLVVTLIFLIGGVIFGYIGFLGGALRGNVPAISLVAFGAASWLLPVALIWQYRLIIEPDAIALGRLGRASVPLAPRSEIAGVARRSVHAYECTVQLIDMDGRPLCEIPACFTGSQLDEIAAALGVSVTAPEPILLDWAARALLPED